MPIAFNRFIEAERGNPVDFCQVAIQNDPGATDCPDHSVNLLNCDGGLCFLRHGRERLFKTFPDRKRSFWLMAFRLAVIGSRLLGGAGEIKKSELRRESC
jgi:hypothetical protein